MNILYYRIDDTGYSDYQSWFEGVNRFYDIEGALKEAKIKRTQIGEFALVRIVKVLVVSTQNEKITLETYITDF